MSNDCTVYVGGLLPGTSDAALAACFEELQPIHSVVIRTFGFVTFPTADAAAAAAEKNLSIDGRTVHAALSHMRYRPVANSSAS